MNNDICYKTKIITTKDFTNAYEVIFGKSNEEKHQDKINDFLKKVGKTFFSIVNSPFPIGQLEINILMITTIVYSVENARDQ